MTGPLEPELIPMRFGLPHMRYPTAYVWLVFVSSLDVILTFVILAFGGHEVNPIAALVIETWGVPGAIGFKFALTLIVIMCCEVVGRRKDHVGRNLAILAVGISAFPVVWSFSLLIRHQYL